MSRRMIFVATCWGVLFSQAAESAWAQEEAGGGHEEVHAFVVEGFPLPAIPLSSELLDRIDTVAREVAEIARDPHRRVTIVGWADAIRWRPCVGTGYDVVCDSLHNQTLADLRAGMVEDRILFYGIPKHRVSVRGKLDPNRGSQYRRVDVYIHSEAMDLERELERLGLLPIRRDTVIVTERIVEERTLFLGVDVITLGVGVTAFFSEPMSAVAPGITLGISHRALPFLAFAEVGYIPIGTGPLCDEANFQVLGGMEFFENVMRAVVGGFTARHFCVSGGPQLTERWLSRMSGIFAGPMLVADVGAVSLAFNANLFWSAYRSAGEQTGLNDNFGVMMRFFVRVP